MAIELTKVELLALYAGIIVALLILTIILVPLNKYKMRRVAAIDHALEALRVSAEKGTPLLFGTGKIDIGIMYAAGVGVVETCYVNSTLILQKYLCTEACKYNTIVNTVTHQPIYAMMSRDFQQQGYLEGGHPELYSPRNITFFPDGYTYGIGMVDVIRRNKFGGGVLIGHSTFMVNAIFVEALAAEGVLNVAGEVWPHDQPVATLGADYTSICEENLAVGAYLSGDKYQMSSMVAEDYVKVAMMALLLILSILHVAGISV